MTARGAQRDHRVAPSYRRRNWGSRESRALFKALSLVCSVFKQASQLCLWCWDALGWNSGLIYVHSCIVTHASCEAALAAETMSSQPGASLGSGVLCNCLHLRVLCPSPTEKACGVLCRIDPDWLLPPYWNRIRKSWVIKRNCSGIIKRNSYFLHAWIYRPFFTAVLCFVIFTLDFRPQIQKPCLLHTQNSANLPIFLLRRTQRPPLLSTRFGTFDWARFPAAALDCSVCAGDGPPT